LSRLLLALVCLCAACSRPEGEVEQADAAIVQLEQACVVDMLKSTCGVMTGPKASQSADVVFVAGVGAVDANAYRELQASGEAMCATVRQACERNWDSGQCQVARSLWVTNSPRPAN
jgi:hypothetical protein